MTFDENFIWGKTLANGEWVEVTPLSRGKKVVAIEVRFGGPSVLGVGGREPNFIFPFDPDMAGMLAEGMSAVLEALEIEGGMEEAAMRVKMEKEKQKEEREGKYPKAMGDVHVEFLDDLEFTDELETDGGSWLRPKLRPRHPKGEND